MGQGARAARHGRRDSYRSATHRHLAVPGQRAGWSWQSLSSRTDFPGSLHARGRPAGVPGPDRGGAAPVATAEAVHGRCACQRRLDHPRRHRPVRSGARRVVSVTGAARPQLSALADQRPLQPAAGSLARVLQAAAVKGRCAGEGRVVLRRNRHDARGTASPVREVRSGGRGGVAGGHRPRDQGGRGGIHDHRSVCVGPGAGACTGRDPQRADAQGSGS